MLGHHWLEPYKSGVPAYWADALLRWVTGPGRNRLPIGSVLGDAGRGTGSETSAERAKGAPGSKGGMCNFSPICEKYWGVSERQNAYIGIMSRVTYFLVALSLAILSGPAFAQKLKLSDVSGYLNSIKTLESPFTQINDDGSYSKGKLYLKRPGKARFQYDGKDAARVVAGQGAVVIYDPKSNQPPESYPLRRTPLSIILARNVDLNRAKMVVGHKFDGTATVIRAQDPDNPDYGSIDLSFTGNPVELRKWVINDSNGGKTTVILGGVTMNQPLSNRLFNTNGPGHKNDR